MKSKVHKAVLATVCCVGTAQAVRAASLFDYNVVVTGTLTDSSHIEGRAFVNNLAASNQPDFAQSAAAGTGDTLDVAGSVTGSGLTIERGVFRHAGALPNNFTLNKNGGATEVLDAAVSIASLSNQMTATAALYNSFAATTIGAPSGNTLNINASGTGVAVFSVSTDDLDNQNEQINVTVGSASAVIIRVLGTSFAFGASEHVAVNGGTQNVIWDFVNANMIHLNDSVWNGSILAPTAMLFSPNQNIEGGVYVQDFAQTAEVHLPVGIDAVTPAFAGPFVVAVPSPNIVLSAIALACAAAAMRGIQMKNSVSL